MQAVSIDVLVVEVCGLHQLVRGVLSVRCTACHHVAGLLAADVSLVQQ